MALGYCAEAGSKSAGMAANYAVAVGGYAKALGDTAVSIGHQAEARTAGSIAIGASAVADQINSVAIGNKSQALGTGATAIGHQSMAAGENSLALGNNASATAGNSVSLGNGSIASETNTVSVGSENNERRITNVAPGINGTDAANINQVNEMQRNIRGVAGHAYSGVAMAYAMSSSRLNLTQTGEKAMGVGIGYYRGQAGLALSFQGISEVGKTHYNIGVTTTGRELGVGAGIGWKWN
jgi:autotransporter adhesin